MEGFSGLLAITGGAGGVIGFVVADRRGFGARVGGIVCVFLVVCCGLRAGLVAGWLFVGVGVAAEVCDELSTSS